MKIAILGSSGEIGARLVQYFLEQGKEVVAFSRTKGSRLARWDNLEFRSINLFNIEESKEKLADIDIIVNLIINKNVDDGIESNIKYNKNLFENLMSICKDLKIKRFVHYSSLVVLPPEVTDKELDNPYNYSKETDWYDVSKIETEKIAIKNRDNFPITIIRPGIVYGPFMHWSIMLFNRMANMNNIIPVEHSCLCYAIHVDDLVKLTDFLINIESENLPQLVYGINPEKVSWNDYYTLHAKETGTLKNLSLLNKEEIKTHLLNEQNQNDNSAKIRKTSFKEFGIDVARNVFNKIPTPIINSSFVQKPLTKLRAANYGLINYGREVGKTEISELWPNQFAMDVYSTSGKITPHHVGTDLGFKYSVNIKEGVKMSGDWWNYRI